MIEFYEIADGQLWYNINQITEPYEEWQCQWEQLYARMLDWGM